MIALLPGRELAVVTLANANTEMPLPGIDGSLDRIPRGVVSLLVGDDPQTGMTLTRFYVIFDLAVVVVLAGLGWSLVRLARRRADGGSRLRLRARDGRGRGEVVLGSVLVIAPSLLWKGYAVALLWVPDLVVVFLAVGGLLVITGVARLGLLRGLERRATGPTSPADHVPRV